MTLHQLLHTITYNLTEDPNHSLYNHLVNGREDMEIGEVWYFVIAFKDEFNPEDFKDNPYQIFYDPNHSPQEYEDLSKNTGYTDIFTQILFKNTGS